MQRFTLLHDGSKQGWQVAYLAFHVAAQLGAPLLVLLTDSALAPDALIQRAAQVEVGGRAAGVTIKTHQVADFSVDVVTQYADDSDGLFVPQRLIPDWKTALRYLEAFSRPLWIVSRESEMRKMAVLVDNLDPNETLVNYTVTLSHRLQQSLTGIVLDSEPISVSKSDAPIDWVSLHVIDPVEINTALQQIEADLFFIPASRISLIDELPLNYVVYPVV